MKLTAAIGTQARRRDAHGAVYKNIRVRVVYTEYTRYNARTRIVLPTAVPSPITVKGAKRIVLSVEEALAALG